jgi:hypothetical protein
MSAEIPTGEEPPLFMALRRADDCELADAGAAGHVAVQLRFDDSGAYLQIVDAKGRDCDIDPRTTRGALRDLLKALAVLRRRQEDLVGWESNADRIYLHHEEHLLWSLRNCPAVVGGGPATARFRSRNRGDRAGIGRRPH